MKIFQFTTISLVLVILLLGCSQSESTKADETKVEPKERASQAAQNPIILFFGNSLTAAYGLDPEEGFTSLIQDRIEEEGKAYKVVNAGLSGETTAGGLNRIDWILERQDIDIFVLELGGNDGLRGIDPKSSFENLKGIVEKVRSKEPNVKIILAGMQAPPNMGKAYTDEFMNIFPELAKELNLGLIPFLLEGVAGIKNLNQRDGIHPTAEGQKILAANIWKILSSYL